MKPNFASIIAISWLLSVLIAGCTTPPSASDSSNPPQDAPTVPPPAPPTSAPGSGLGGAAELPPVPDFEAVLSYGGGGGGGDPGCSSDPGIRPALTIEPEDFRLTENYIELCLWGAVKPGVSFRVGLISPEGRKFLSHALSADSDWNLQWEGYPGVDELVMSYVQPSGDAGIAVSWPADLPEGIWQASASIGNTELTAQALIKRSGKPSISAIHPGTGTEILPALVAAYSLPFRPLPFLNNGPVDVRGVNYPINTPVFVLLYKSDTPTNPINYIHLRLVHQQTVLSDAQGKVNTQLGGPFEGGLPYVLIGTSDPNAKLASDPDFYFAGQVPHDGFRIESPSPTADVSSSSCPGAPPQRMVVGQRGRVCTQSDAVLLRSSPWRSAGTIGPLRSGSEFKVLKGPSCADNWSWWQIQTGSGTVAWIAEGGDETDPYFICPLP